VDVADLVVAVIRAILRERIVQFAVIGVVIFAVARGPASPTRISLTANYLGALRAAQAERLGVSSLSGDRTLEVDRRAIEDEVLYREALRLGLDRGDAIVRRHLIQKMLVLAEDLAGATREPTLKEVEAYFTQTRDRWTVAEQLHLVHVFAAKRETLVAIGDAVRATPGDAAPPLGDAFPRSRDVRGSRADLAATYGDEFADAALQLRVGEWSPPVPSRFGWHLVKVVDHGAGRLAAFTEVAERVRLELAVERRHRAIADFLAKAAARYQVDIDGEPVRDYQPTPRLAVRSLPSAED
jgi:peptidyl-prolyl cis-trans isomerase C